MPRKKQTVASQAAARGPLPEQPLFVSCLAYPSSLPLMICLAHKIPDRSARARAVDTLRLPSRRAARPRAKSPPSAAPCSGFSSLVFPSPSLRLLKPSCRAKSLIFAVTFCPEVDEATHRVSKPAGTRPETYLRPAIARRECVICVFHAMSGQGFT